jgi:hypothetical protein
MYVRHTYLQAYKMPLVSENIALIIFGVILVISAGLAWYMKSYAAYEPGMFHTFIAILSGLGVFVTFMFYYNVLLLQNQQQQLAALEQISNINSSVIDSVLDSMIKSSTIIPNFVLSITPLTNQVCCSTGTTGSTGCSIPVELDPITPETCTQKMVLSYRIFSLWQDVITSNKLIDFDPTAYVSNFLQRANSSQLYVQWTAAKIDFNPNTQTFGDLLFRFGLPITVQTPEEYSAVAIKLISDPQFQNIINT